MPHARIAVPDRPDALLTVTDRSGKAIRRLDPGEQEAMLAAFARPGATHQDRERGAAVVRAVQRYNRWLSCECLGPGEVPPVLVPVEGTFIRRDPHRPDHADGCPFERDAHDRVRHAKSLRAPRVGTVYRLAPAFPTVGPGPVRRKQERDDGADEDLDAAGAAARRGSRKAYYRDSLARLLFDLLHVAKVDRLGPGPRGWAAQVEALRAAACGILLGGSLRLSDVLETDPGRLDALVARIQQRKSWPNGCRPHGVLVFVAARIEDDAVVTASGAQFAIEGPISMSGPGRGRVRHGPFVAVVLVASPDGHSPPVPLKAYAQLCWSADDMLPVDSAHERRCLDILTEFRDRMAGLSLDVEIQKPLFDRSRYYAGREEVDAVVKPDFEGVIRTASGEFVRSFVVEVMGLDTPEYRRSKWRLRRLVEEKRMRYIEHVAHGGVSREAGDAGLRRALEDLGRRAVERAAMPRRPAAATPEPKAAPWNQVSIPPRAPAVQDPAPARPSSSAPAWWPALSPSPLSATPTAAPPSAPARLPPRLPSAPPPVPEQPSRLRCLWNRLLGTR